MARQPKGQENLRQGTVVFLLCGLFGIGFLYVVLFGVPFVSARVEFVRGVIMKPTEKIPEKPVLDKAEYDRRMIALANYPVASSTSTTTPPKVNPWPALSAPYPKARR